MIHSQSCSLRALFSHALCEPYSKLIFYRPREIQAAINHLVDSAAGPTGLLMAAMEVIKDPLLINPPFHHGMPYQVMWMGLGQ
jgi:hypothetical protein